MLAKEDPESVEVKRCLADMKRVFGAWQRMKGATGRFWTKVVEESPMQYTLVHEYFEEAANAKPSFSRTDELKKSADIDSRHWAQTAVVERKFRLIRRCELERADKYVSDWKIWLKAAVDQLLSKEHHWVELDLEELHQEEGKRVPRSGYEMRYKTQSLKFKKIRTKRRKAPYPTFNPRTSSTQYEDIELGVFLNESAKDGANIPLGPAVWRTQFLAPGLVVEREGTAMSGGSLICLLEIPRF